MSKEQNQNRSSSGNRQSSEIKQQITRQQEKPEPLSVIKENQLSTELPTVSSPVIKAQRSVEVHKKNLEILNTDQNMLFKVSKQRNSRNTPKTTDIGQFNSANNYRVPKQFINTNAQRSLNDHQFRHGELLKSNKNKKGSHFSMKSADSKFMEHQLFGSQFNTATTDLANVFMPNYEPTKCSSKKNGFVKGYAANTNQGIVRNYNEDRVSIILNIMKPSSRSKDEIWPKCSFFGIYDGHGGASCADFLRDNLHQFIIKEDCFPQDPVTAINNGFHAAEQYFMNAVESQSQGNAFDRSGDRCYIVNVGDSRSVLSAGSGESAVPLSEDHRPDEESEQQRIIKGGGQIYQTQTQAKLPGQNGQMRNHTFLGPHRVLPGRLSVSRTFGDIEAKNPKYGGNPNVVIAKPDIKSFQIEDHHDFVAIACDGVFEKLNNEDIVGIIWDNVRLGSAKTIHEACGIGVESILKTSIFRKSLDNITCVLVSFKNFKHKLFPKQPKEIEQALQKSDIKPKQEETGLRPLSFKAQKNQSQDYGMEQAKRIPSAKKKQGLNVKGMSAERPSALDNIEQTSNHLQKYLTPKNQGELKALNGVPDYSSPTHMLHSLKNQQIDKKTLFQGQKKLMAPKPTQQRMEELMKLQEQRKMSKQTKSRNENKKAAMSMKEQTLNSRFGLNMKIDRKIDENQIPSSRTAHNRKAGSVVQNDAQQFYSPQGQKDITGNWTMQSRQDGIKQKSTQARNKYGSMGANEYLNEILLQRKKAK